MLDQPLKPFAPPSVLLTRLHFSGVLSSGAVVMGILAVVLVFWALYTLVAVYHWLKYSHASWVAFPAIAVHLFMSFAFIMYALPGIII